MVSKLFPNWQKGLAIVLGLALLPAIASAQSAITHSAAAPKGDAPAQPQAKPSYNGIVQISEQLVNRMVERPILERQTVRNNVSGTVTVADTTTKGRLQVEFVPSADRAIIDFRLIGALSAPNATATRRQVTVRVASETSIDARKRVVATPDGLFPAKSDANCNTDSQILHVEADSKVMERIGRRRAEKMRPEAQHAASKQVAEQVEQQLDAQAKDPLAEANRFYIDKMRLPLVDLGGFPSEMKLSTTDTHIQMKVLAWKTGQTMPPAEGPNLATRHDVAVYGHQSIVANMTEPLIGGKTFGDKQFLELIRILTGRASRGLWVFDGRPRWSVTFAQREPVSVVFADGTFRMTFHFAAATCGTNSVRAPMEASALYRPEMTPNGPHLVRESNIVLRYTDELEDTKVRVAIREELSQRFDAFFQPDIFFDGLSPPAGGTYAKLKDLKLTELRCEDGWFIIGYDLDEPSKVALHR